MIFKETKNKKLELNVPSEKVVHQQICDFLKLQYPEVIFTSDASGMRVSIGLRVELKRKRCAKYKIPDIIILQPSRGYHGLVLEVKKKGEKLYKKDGAFVSEHVQEQFKSINRFKEMGYAAGFAIGYEEGEAIIKDYLNG